MTFPPIPRMSGKGTFSPSQKLRCYNSPVRPNQGTWWRGSDGTGGHTVRPRGRRSGGRTPLPREPRDRSGRKAEVALPRAPVSISRRDSANLRPTSARGGGPPRSPSLPPARPPGPSAPAPRTPRPPPPPPLARSPARPAPRASRVPREPDPAWSRLPLAAAGSAPHLLSSSWEAEAAAAAMLRPGASERASQGGREGRTGGEGGSRPSPCRVAPRRAAGARGRLGSLTRGRAAPPRPARRLRPPRGERRSRRPAPRELATRAAPPLPRASEEPLPPVRPRDRARAAALRLGARLARLTPALIFRKS